MLLKSSDITQIVIVTRTKDRIVHAYQSNMDVVEALGLFEAGKMIIYGPMGKGGE